jgi:C-terminal processing protease CtpA/Prc
VIFVTAGGEAEKAGVKQGDRISAVNDMEVSRSNLREVLSKLIPGRTPACSSSARRRRPK